MCIPLFIVTTAFFIVKFVVKDAQHTLAHAISAATQRKVYDGLPTLFGIVKCFVLHPAEFVHL